MIKIRNANERGISRTGWLNSRHTFSFGSYRDPQHMGFRGLRVINDDRVIPGMGFGEHPHRDMEIISYVVEGALQHRDSMGNGSVINAGDVQLLSAGSGITHSEFNASKTEPVRFLQIWLPPSSTGLKPRYAQQARSRTSGGELELLFSPDGRDDSIEIRTDAYIYGTKLTSGNDVTVELAKGRHAWVQVVTGAIDLAGHELVEGDGAAISDEEMLKITAKADADVLIFDLK
ncbi:pirin family protein [Bradymonas sediminis]|uniref:Pirin family protein n=1 Tax=Bradymonas sediminis TaxID=1548548 RepID=A0A2Z4FG28_9DELT|nr:pirin family protein [Bradymonas sediminis]AWV87857.1 pirin family protein [Bradymonas sediminis]TDP62869.1 hypothetical protein DFR33_1111 [Bradymonas sediminis]